MQQFSTKQQRKRVPAECQNCHQTYFRRSDDKESRYCSSRCYGQYRMRHERIDVYCRHCKGVINISRSQAIYRPRAYCSKACRQLAKRPSDKAQRIIALLKEGLSDTQVAIRSNTSYDYARAVRLRYLPELNKRPHHVERLDANGSRICVDCAQPIKTVGKICVRCTNRRTRKKLKAEIVAAYGGKCACCGIAEPDFLTLDHVYNDGAAHRRLLDGATGSKFYAELKKQGFPQDRYQLLCWNCNCAKALCGVCPHMKEKTINASNGNGAEVGA